MREVRVNKTHEARVEPTYKGLSLVGQLVGAYSEPSWGSLQIRLTAERLNTAEHSTKQDLWTQAVPFKHERRPRPMRKAVTHFSHTVYSHHYSRSRFTFALCSSITVVVFLSQSPSTVQIFCRIKCNRSWLYKVWFRLGDVIFSRHWIVAACFHSNQFVGVPNPCRDPICSLGLYASRQSGVTSTSRDNLPLVKH